MKRFIQILVLASLTGATAFGFDLRGPRNRSSGGKECTQVNVAGTMVDALCLDASSGTAATGAVGSQSTTGGGAYRFRIDDSQLGLQIRAGSNSSHFPLTIQTAGGSNLFTLDGTGAATFIKDATNSGSFYQKISNGAVSMISTGAPSGGTGSLSNTQFVDVTFNTSGSGQMMFMVADGGNDGDVFFCSYAPGTCTKVTNTAASFNAGNGATGDRIYMPNGAATYVVRLKNCTGSAGSIAFTAIIGPISSVSAVQTGTCP